MRVLHLYAGNLFGGIERMLLALARRDESARPHFGLCFDGLLAEKLRAAGAPVTILGAARMSRPWSVSLARRRLRELLATEAFDVAVTHSFWPHGLFGPVIRRAGLPLALWIHDVPGGRSLVERWACRASPDLVLANSRFTASHVPHVFGDVRCEVQYPAVEPPPRMEPAIARARVRGELRTSERSSVIVIASRLERLKGHHVLLHALAMLPTTTLWECWIAGAPQRSGEQLYLDELKEQADRLDISMRVRFLGYRDDVAAVLAAADIFCQPNTAPEGFGVVFVEAMAAGLPVVTSDFGAAGEILNQACGRLVPARDPESLGAQLDVLINDPQLRAELARAGRQRAEKFTDLEASSARLLALLGTIADQPVAAESQ